ncbi:MAG: aminopeptidase P family protein [Tannerella sp.]|jgi:Xaa-Pro aminopeptidase|nr:aminopeptidase P family protein [Tannerella sp.]
MSKIEKTNERIALLRNYMKANELHAFVVPSTDAHISEYIPEHWESRKWLSGFTGSAGTLVVTLDKAALWTDSRYFLQAAAELSGSEIMLFKDRLPETISIPDWLKSELSDCDRVGIDGNVFSAKESLKLKSELGSIRLAPEFDPFREIWSDRPPLPENKLFVQPVRFAGETVREKIERVLRETETAGAESLWISALDSIAWLFNIRGSDVPYNPVVISHAFISQDRKILFVDSGKVDNSTAEYLKNEGLEVMDYNKALEFIVNMRDLSVCIDSSKIAYIIYKAIEKQNRIIDKPSVVDLLKSMKNEVEADGFRRVMVRDGLAMTKFLMWLEEAVPAGKVTEYNIGLKLKELRGEQENAAGESFPTIAGYAANGAINHYHPNAETALQVKPEGFLLIDSGGQYLDGTTDITRTVAVGEITEAMKKDYTLVLKGMIGLSRAVFPAGTRGSQIDILARKSMWEQGINFLHGTGHGVGQYLNVHEGPQSIRPEENPAPLRLGMIVTNEPGIYRDNEYGVRTENMMLTTLAMSTGYGDFYKFETLTLCPIDTAPIIRELMSDEEIIWLNDYHKKVAEKLSPYLSDGEKAWLKNKTKTIVI